MVGWSGARILWPTFGQPIDRGAWLLLFLSVGLGLGLEVAFYRARRRNAASAYLTGRRLGPLLAVAGRVMVAFAPPVGTSV